MPKRVNQLDLVANDLAQWIDATADEIAVAMLGGASAPFAARITDEQKISYYTHMLFMPDGSPNQAGRNQELARLGSVGFRRVYNDVMKAHPEFREAEGPDTPEPPPPEIGKANPAPEMNVPSPFAGAGVPDLGAMLPQYQPGG